MLGAIRPTGCLRLPVVSNIPSTHEPATMSPTALNTTHGLRRRIAEFKTNAMTQTSVSLTDNPTFSAEIKSQESSLAAMQKDIGILRMETEQRCVQSTSVRTNEILL
eukprot:Protomagalhaensia_sp_Gyna_25__5092@NODE_582_length_3071_cov_72_807388_g450_i0_p8_GENE_NODE_582_length_3071_cov_72_807388_g450_i0NODE_582_length_3071_cov_72_807388_g450_i0_p8_ORF_typecomplete_len107_score5_06DUF3519/PF12033_8/0_019_NODE_582_length_3071_cov_72_807388_g450_i019702290